VHQPLRGFLVEIEDVFHNIISRKTLNRPKEMNAVSTKVLLPFFPPVCTFAPSLFSQVGLTILWNTNCQIYNFTLSNHHFHISTFRLQTSEVYIILRAAQNVRPVLKKTHWLPNFFLKLFLPKLCLFGLFSFEVGGGLGLVAYPPTS